MTSLAGPVAGLPAQPQPQPQQQQQQPQQHLVRGGRVAGSRDKNDARAGSRDKNDARLVLCYSSVIVAIVSLIGGLIAMIVVGALAARGRLPSVSLSPVGGYALMRAGITLTAFVALVLLSCIRR